MTDTQDDAPLAAAARVFLAEPGTPFTTPGHKRNPDLVDHWYAGDLPYCSGADDARAGGDLLGRAERLAAGLWGAALCRFSVAGSSHGNLALALAAARPGDRVIVPRTLHKSLFNGMILAGLEPVWLHPDVDAATGLPLGIAPERLSEALAAAPDARAVFLVEPSYVGVLSRREELIAIAHAHGAPVIVDQAWGAHLGFHPGLPANALCAGADALVLSAHKTLTSWTQGAMVFAQPGRLELERVAAAFELLNTTSPSALILASLDDTRSLVHRRGDELFSRLLALAAEARAALAAIPGVALVDERVAAHHSVGAVDPAKLVISLAGTGANGFAVERTLLEAGIHLEMTDRDTLIPLLTIGDEPEAVGRLTEALTRAIEQHRGAARHEPGSCVWRLRPEQAMSPRAAFFAAHATVGRSDAVGRVAAETVVPYPPGVPAIAPGEIITAELIEALCEEQAHGTRIAYAADSTLRTLRVVAGP